MGKDKNNRDLSVDEIYEKASKLAPEEVSEFLDEVCSEDPSIRRQVEAMLAAPDDFLDDPVAPEIAGKLEEAADDAAHGEKNSPAGIADRNLLYGIIALQMNFISRNALIKAMHDWVLTKTTPIEEIFYDNKAIGSATKLLLTALAEKHLEHHAGDARASLKTMSSTAGIREELSTIGDPDLDDSLTGMGTGDAETIPVTREPTRAGERFQILRFFDKGGMGKVSIAQDAELNREVAFKEIRDDCADIPEFQNRFKIEAEITGGLEHPGIVPVYGLGTLDDGRPFYAMRLIKGDNLKIAIRDYRNNREQASTSERNLELRRLLRRFIDVCEAVHYAHSRKVLHRDLKPGNIMLGRYGETLVLDWGLAKAVGNRNEHDPEATLPLVPQSGDSAAPTRGTIGTPSYMSPEQARNDEIGPATDVFSLGATLYYLLCGRAPYVVHEDDPEKRAQQTLRLARHCEFAEPHEIDKQVPLPLNAICLKAMRSDPKERYSTTQDFANDIERWLADEPVSVYRDPFIDRFARTVRRHRATAAGTVAVLGTALVATIVISVIVQQNNILKTEQNAKLNIANQDLEEANRNLEAANQLAESDFEATRRLSFELVKESEGTLSQSPGMESYRRDITNLALDSFRQYFSRRSKNDPKFQRDMAQLFLYAANLDRFHGDFDLAESKYKNARDILRIAVRQTPTDTDSRNRLTVAILEYSAMLLSIGELTQASENLYEAEHVFRSLRPNYKFTDALINSLRADLQHESFDLDTAQESHKKAESLFRDLLSRDPENDEVNSLLIFSLTGQCRVLRDMEKTNAALAIAMTAVQEIEKSTNKSSNRYVRHAAAHASLEYARSLIQIGGDDENKENQLLNAIRIWSELNSKFPSHNYEKHLVVCLALNAQISLELANELAAKKSFNQAAQMANSLLTKHGEIPGVLENCAEVFLIGALFPALDNTRSSNENFEQAIRLLKQAQETSQESVRIGKRIAKIQSMADQAEGYP